MSSSSLIRVGLTEGHGSAMELMQDPPEGVAYSYVGCVAETPRWVQSPIGGFLRTFDSAEHDLVEAVLCPAITNNRWICTLAYFQEGMAFKIRGVPTPRYLRRLYLERLFLQPQFKGLVFWSEAGRQSLTGYGGVTDERILSKTKVIYPAIKKVPDEKVSRSDAVKTILFSGDFFRKGGVNVVDAFLRLETIYPDTRLIICSDTNIDFRTSNSELRAKYLAILTNHSKIEHLGRVPRDKLLNEILPVTDVYVIPTYADTFGFAILEAMAYGIPVIATNISAIPELITNKQSGLLIDVSQFDVEAMFKSYTVDQIPRDFRECVTEGLFERLRLLIDDASVRNQIKTNALTIAREKFGSKRRNAELRDLYEHALA